MLQAYLRSSLLLQDSQGVLLLIPLLYKSLIQRRYRSIPLGLLPLLSIICLFVYFYHLTGNLFITFEVEREWAKGTVSNPGTYLVFPLHFLLFFIQNGLHFANYWRIVLVFMIYTLALFKLRKDIDLMLFTLPTFLLVISLSPFPTFWFGLDRLLIPIFPVFYAYEEYICKSNWKNRALFLGLIVFFFIQAFRIIERWCLLAPAS